MTNKNVTKTRICRECGKEFIYSKEHLYLCSEECSRKSLNRQVNKCNKEWRLNNIDRYKERQKKQYLKHKDARIKYSREYYQEHKEELIKRFKEYAITNRFSRILTVLKNRVKFKKCYNGLPVTLTKEQIEHIWYRDGADKMVKPEIHRIYPLKGYVLGNCQYLEKSVHKKIPKKNSK